MDDKGHRLAQLSVAAALAYGSYAMCRAPVLPLFARELGASPASVGAVVAASTLTGVVLKFPAGAISDVLGRRVVLVVGAVVFALMPFSYLAVTALGSLVLARVVHGSATALFGPAASATLSDLAPPDRRGRWLSAYSAAQGTGQALGPVVAASLVVGHDYTRAFVVSGVGGIVALAVLLPWPAMPVAADGGAAAARLWASVRATAADTRVLGTSLAQAGQFFVNGTMAAFLPLYAHERLLMAPSQIGWLFGAQTAATLLARPVFGALSDRLGRRPLIVAGLAACAAGVALVSTTDRFPLLLLVTTGYGVGLAVTTSATSAYVTDLTRRARYGAAHGLFGTIYDVGDALGPICAGLVAASAGYARAFHVAGVTALAIALFFWWASRGWDAPDADVPGLGVKE